MSTRRHWTYLAWLWLSIATIFTHAVLPLGSPIARTSGSAFSASTIDVSLGPSRRGEPGKQKKAALGADAADSESSRPLDPPSTLPSPDPQIPVRYEPATVADATASAACRCHRPVGFQPRAPPFA